MSWELIHGDCLEEMAKLPDASVDAVVCDPPYGLEFMGKEWDRLEPNRSRYKGKPREMISAAKFKDFKALPSFGSQERNPKCANCDRYKWDHEGRKCSCHTPDFRRRGMGHEQQAWHGEWAEAIYRIAKPGAHLVAFGGTRTYHRLACALEDAGWEIRDCLAWLYGSGFSKGGLLGNRPDLAFCVCKEPVPYTHAESTTERDMRRVRGTDLPEAEHVVQERGQVLFEGLQEPGSPPQRSTGDQPGDARGEQPGLAGRNVHRTREGLSDDTQTESPEGESERVRPRTSTGGGGDAGQAAPGWRGGSPSERTASRQPTREPEGVREPSGALDGRALRDGGTCARCGQLRKEFAGFSVTLKPAHEPIVLARKPLAGTVAANVERFGTGALNVNGCRVGTTVETWPATRSGRGAYMEKHHRSKSATERTGDVPSGRWPPNVLLGHAACCEPPLDLFHKGDGLSNIPTKCGPCCPVGMLDEHSGERLAGTAGRRSDGVGMFKTPGHDEWGTFGDTGTASRFFPRFKYVAKASTSERGEGCTHPTVKPVALMRWLCRLVTPPGGTILDPFAGSGTTIIAALREGFSAIGIEREQEYVEIARRRIEEDAPLFNRVAGEGPR